MELQTKENSIQELKNENVEKEERILTKKDVTKSWWLWWLSVEVSNSFERLQALACCISMIPILRKLYKNEDDFRAGLKRHLQFFNTESTWGAITLGVAVAMEEQKAMGKQIPDEAINSVKTCLLYTSEQNGGCCGLSAVDDARRVADWLEIPYYVMNFKSEFRKNVMDYFTAEYLKGRTPNPCIACNRYVKWEALLERSMAIGADYIATGHYARIEQLSNGRYAIKNSVTALKDQTYALYNLTQEQLKRTLMPVGDYTKDEICAIAEETGLMVAHKKDSMEICFIPDDDYAGFIDRECNGQVPPPGNFVSTDGKILGRHKGITHYTIGQQKGLGIAFGYPVFVTEIRPDTNEVVLGTNEDVYKRQKHTRMVTGMR